jgi:hypothetical protein
MGGKRSTDGERRNECKIWSESVKERGVLEDLGADGRKILKRMQKM